MTAPVLLRCGLTPRQLAVLAGRARGLDSQVIAADLGLTPDQVKRALRDAARALAVECAGGAALVDAAYRTGLMDRLPVEPRPGVVLTARRQVLLGRLAEGLTDRQIAAVSGRSYNTVRTNVRLLLDAVDARSRAHAVALAHQHGWLAGPAGPGVVFGRRVRVGEGFLVHGWDGSRTACSTVPVRDGVVTGADVSCGACRKRLGLDGAVTRHGDASERPVAPSRPRAASPAPAARYGAPEAIREVRP